MLPKEMEDALTAAHGKQRSNAEGPAVKGLEKTLNTMSLRMHEAQQQGTSIGDTGIINLLANLDITPGETAAETSLRAAQRWASTEDQEDVIEAQQLDQAESVAASLKGLALEGRDSSDSQDEENDDRLTTETLQTETLEAVPLSHRRRTRNFPNTSPPWKATR